jgi:hypothetical protein
VDNGSVIHRSAVGYRRQPCRDGSVCVMHCFYSYDPRLDLYAVVVSAADGRQWAVVMDPVEFEALAARVATSPWLAGPLDVEEAAVWDLLHQVTGRDLDEH